VPQVPQPRKFARFYTIIAIVLWCFLLWKALGTFGPGTAIKDVEFNSDSAITVLMANDDRPFSIFNFYYYAADRWGGWPYLMPLAIHKLTGFHWTAESVFFLQAAWVFLGAFVFAGLCRGDEELGAVPAFGAAAFGTAAFAAAAYLAVVAFHFESRYFWFELSQLYAWQSTALLLGWYGFRRVFDSASASTSRSMWLWALATFGAALLAIWSSVASIGMLVGLLCLEVLRASVKPTPKPKLPKVLAPAALGAIAVVAATIVERLMKISYNRYGAATYGDDFSTDFHIDYGHILENVATQLHHITKLSWWPLYALPTIALLTIMLIAPFAWRRVRSILSDDITILALGAYAIAAMNFAATVIVDYVRKGMYDTRYLTLTNLFGPISGILTIYLLLTLAVARSPRASRVSRYLQPAFAIALLGLLIFRFPTSHTGVEYRVARQVAVEVARKAPRALLMGGYWDTYVLTALQPVDAMVPVPIEAEMTRTPWTGPLVQQASEVIYVWDRRHVNEVPPAILRQQGTTLRLVDPGWYINSWFMFARYINESPRRASSQRVP
jgi:hypothetical protein